MQLLQDIITYIRRIIKTPSGAVITDALIIDYINRFWINDIDARVQLYDFKTKYQFMTAPGIDQYNMPLYSIQIEPGNQQISYYPVYQGFFGPAFINGIEVPFFTQRESFFNVWPNYTQTLIQTALGDGTAGPYELKLPFLPNSPNQLNQPQTSGIIRAHIDITGVIAANANTTVIQDPPFGLEDGTSIPLVPTTSVYPAVYFTTTGAKGENLVICDSGQFLEDEQNKGLLMQPGAAPFGNSALPSNYDSTTNVIDYLTGIAENVFFPAPVPAGMPINASCFFYQEGIPRALLFFNNTIILRAPPNTQYLVELNAYLSPAAFLSTGQAIQFGYMSEYIARGAARKILSDTGDTEQFMFYEPLFLEQETLVWKRSQRQFTSTRTQSLYSAGTGFQSSGNNFGQGTT